MIYLKETYDLCPATPKSMDSFISIVKEQLLPAYKTMGVNLVAAWFTNVESLFQVNQLFEINNIMAFESFHRETCENTSYKDIMTQLTELTEKKVTHLYEPLTPVFTDTLHKTIEESKNSEIKDFTIAELSVKNEHMEEFISQLERGVNAGVPMIISLRPIIGDRNSITDIWKINLQLGYQPQEFYNQIGFNEEWWDGMRKMAPREKMTAMYPLPYSPIK